MADIMFLEKMTTSFLKKAIAIQKKMSYTGFTGPCCGVSTLIIVSITICGRTTTAEAEAYI